MKQLSIRLSLCLIVIFFSIPFVQGQQFMWVHGGGTSQDLSGDPNNEGSYYMCTDYNGNIYSLNIVGDNPITADTFYRAAGAYGNPNNIFLTSYTCNGQMRWAKLIAATDQTTPYGIVADNSGHIYVAGHFQHVAGTHTFYIGYDTVIGIDPYLAAGLIQFDTSGNYKWIQFVGNNALTSIAAINPDYAPLAMDGSNNVHFFPYIKTGVPLMPGDTTRYGVYDMTYNSSGTLLSVVRLDLDSQWFLNGAVIDPGTNKLYACGGIDVNFEGGSLTDTSFAAAFDASRNALWWRFPGLGDNDDFFTGITLDQSKHLHFIGDAQTSTLTATTFSFNGDSVVDTRAADYYDMCIIMTTDTNGHPDWITKFEGNSGVNEFSSITQLPNNKVAAVGTLGGIDVSGMDSIITPSGEGQNPFLVIVDSAGDVQTIQQIHGDGFYDGGNAITSDKIGNVYVGGEVVSGIWGGTISPYYSVGGNTDFFVMKYGVDCSCTSMPTASYTLTGINTINTTYTGTTVGIDSVVWNFGDGSATATGSTATHTYTDTGKFRVCVTVYTGCGSDIYCSNVDYEPALVTVVPSMPNIRVYPNPANDELNITGITENTNYQLLNVTGTTIIQGVLSQGSNVVPMKSCLPGIYILEMPGADGQRNIVRVVKE